MFSIEFRTRIKKDALAHEIRFFFRFLRRKPLAIVKLGFI